jgi:glycosyltransferase involved in cell wall biosynthesis
MGGAEQGLLDLALHLGPQRCHVVLLADGDLHRILKRTGISVRVLHAGSAFMGVRRAGSAARALAALPQTLVLACKLAAAARSHDMIYANSQKAALVAMLAGALARRPVIWHLHDILAAGQFGWLQRHALAMLSNKLTRRVIVVSAAARNAYIASGGKPGRARLVYNGIDPHPYDGLAETSREFLRGELGLSPGLLVGLFGRITEWKGQRVLIEALPRLPHAQALIVGSPMFGQDAELTYLKSLAERLGVAARVRFLGQRPDVPRLMRAVDLVVHCSTAPEPFGRVIVEALLAGTPVLAAEGGASREILGDTDWVVKANDPAALAAAIDRVMARADTEELARLRTRISENFLLDRMMALLDGVIAEALYSRPPRGEARGGGSDADAERHNQESPSVLKKRNKRLLCLRRSHDRGPNSEGMGRDLSAGAGIKVFLLLFLQKKKALLTSIRHAFRPST